MSTKPTFFWNAATLTLNALTVARGFDNCCSPRGDGSNSYGKILTDDRSGSSGYANIATLTNGATLTLNDIWTA